MARDLFTYLEHIRVNAESTQRLFGTAYKSFAIATRQSSFQENYTKPKTL